MKVKGKQQIRLQENMYELNKNDILKTSRAVRALID